MDVPEANEKIWSWKIIDETNYWSKGMYIQKPKNFRWPFWLTMKQLTDHNGRLPMHPDDAYNQGWLSMTQMIVHDEGLS